MTKSKLTMIVIGVALLGGASACGSTSSQTPPPTRAATQTPWIIYVPVTSTPEPATVTPLPTVTTAAPVRTATKAVVRPTATKAPPTAAPVAAAPTASPAPACNLGTATPTFPENGAPRSAGGAIIFKWSAPPSVAGQGDARVGYMLQIISRRGGQQVNGDTLYISDNKYTQDGNQFVYDRRAVSSLAGGDTAIATWNITIVKTSGGFNDGDPTARPPGLVTCGSTSLSMTIELVFNQ